MSLIRRFVLAALVTAALPALAADVGVSISVGQPGFYGRLDIGGFPPPQVVYNQPVIVERAQVQGPPLYLRVPPGHARHWAKHCREYNACGERVYFVKDGWYNQQYVPRYREQHRDRRDERQERQDDNRGNREGRGENHDHGHGHERNR